ncbi:MAG TPA: helix-turn-helix transcriptional regulator [Stellaceae bacterium]|nr:helix-turn-helix transcriptional regulator [Stellaceae bacterium]
MSGLAEISTAEDLAAWLKRMNLSISAAAEHLGRKRATIARYLNGETEMPESVGRMAAVVEAARRGKPFENRGRSAHAQFPALIGFR